MDGWFWPAIEGTDRVACASARPSEEVSWEDGVLRRVDRGRATAGSRAPMSERDVLAAAKEKRWERLRWAGTTARTCMKTAGLTCAARAALEREVAPVAGDAMDECKGVCSAVGSISGQCQSPLVCQHVGCLQVESCQVRKTEADVPWARPSGPRSTPGSRCPRARATDKPHPPRT